MRTCFAVLLLLALSLPVSAHDSAEWIQKNGIKNAVGDLCCGENDCKALADDDIKITSGGYLIKSINETVPFHEAIPLPNIPEAMGKYWRCYWGGKRKCFFAPPGSS